MDLTYLNTQIIDSSDLEEDVQSPHNLLEAGHKVYCSMANNEQDSKVKNPAQFYKNYRCSLKHHCATNELIFSIYSTQVENERNLSIAVFSVDYRN